MKLTLGQVFYYLLPYFSKEQGDEYVFQCPYCIDSGKDNMKFNAKKGILHCFANPVHSKLIFKKIMNNPVLRKYSQIPEYKLEEKYNKYLLPNWQEHFAICTDLYCTYLLENTELLNYLQQKRGITPKTAEFMKIGFNPITQQWIIPNFKYTTGTDMTIFGFEFRPKNFSKRGLYRLKGSPSMLASVNRFTQNTEILCIVEGYFDAYTLWQHLEEQGQSEKYHIITPPSGVNSLVKHINNIEFQKYKRHYLFLDNDEAAQPVKDKVISRYPFFREINLSCGCKDFNEHYLKCINKIN